MNLSNKKINKIHQKAIFRLKYQYEHVIITYEQTEKAGFKKKSSWANQKA